MLCSNDLAVGTFREPCATWSGATTNKKCACKRVRLLALQPQSDPSQGPPHCDQPGATAKSLSQRSGLVGHFMATGFHSCFKLILEVNPCEEMVPNSALCSQNKRYQGRCVGHCASFPNHSLLLATCCPTAASSFDESSIFDFQLYFSSASPR